MNLSEPVSMDLIDRIERTIQFTECNNTVGILRECEEEISKLRAALRDREVDAASRCDRIVRLEAALEDINILSDDYGTAVPIARVALGLK